MPRKAAPASGDQPGSAGERGSEPPAWQRARTTLVVSVLILVLAAWSFVAAGAYPEVSARAPRFVAVIAVVTSAVTAIQSSRDLTRHARRSGMPLTRLLSASDALNRTLVVGLLTVGYIALFQTIGFILSTALFAGAVGYLLGVRRILALVLLGPVTALMLHLVFTEVFGIRLPPV